MGVPAFFRWLTEKYPRIIQDVLEERVQVAPNSTSVRLPFDARAPNPSGLECDNLYIDMNGIIHPCSHPENGPQPKTEEEMYENVCEYVDRLFRAIRPRKLLYLGIDGVAPRAKMNQQRSRRFRSAQEARELQELEETIRVELSQSGQKSPPAKKAWDSNVITPGTPFMLKLSEYIRFYIRKRLSTDPAWKNLRVIFSDASLPGEGEHKIMSHIRLQRAQPGYDPNTVHVMHGLDADLIMLALATHEAHFYISREEVVFGRKSQEVAERRQLESGFRDAQRQLDEKGCMELPENQQKPLQRVSIPILREYLEFEFSSCLKQVPFTPSLERIIDDVVFLCFFVGNDFLPHLPSLDIRDGALDFLFNVYKRLLPGMGDYITKSGGNVNLSSVDILLSEVGAIEDYVFSMKHENEMREKERRSYRRKPPPPPPEPPKVKGRAARILEKRNNDGPVALKSRPGVIQVSHKEKSENADAAKALKEALARGTKRPRETVLEVNKPEASTEKEPQSGESELNEPADESAKLPKDPAVVGDMEDEFDADDGDDDEDEDELPKIENVLQIEEVDPEAAKKFKERVKAEQQLKLDQHSKNVEDKVRLHEAGWKDRYYTDKCKADDVANHGGREHLFRSYVVGLCWVMKYYYEGCVSWKWYFPFHYAPFASDLKNIERFEKDCRSFELGTPFNPVEQLMGVLPSDSAHAIPKASRWLMSDPESPIIDFYPMDVPVDPNGKAMPWLWVVLLPFIEEDRLLAAMSPTMAKWTKSELLCNARGLDDGYLYVSKENGLTKKLAAVLTGPAAMDKKLRLTDSASYGCPGFSGSVRPPLTNEMYPIDEDSAVQPPSTAGRIDRTGSIFAEAVEPNDAVCVAFSEPSKLSHKSILLPGVIVLPPALAESDKVIRRPRLNRGGGTIANLGTSNGQSYKEGYGSMNRGTYERDLANRTGRGADMYRTGNRAWGAMEPMPKRRHADQQPPRGAPAPPYQQNQWNGGNQQYQPHGYHQASPQNYGRGPQPGYPYQNNGPQGGYHQQRGNNGNFQRQQTYQQGPQYQGSYRGGHHGAQHPPHRNYYPNNGRGGPPPPPPPPQQQQQQQGYNFRGHNGGPPYQQGSGANSRRSRASADVMNSLRAQLTSTLNQNRGRGGGRGNQR